MLPVLNIGPLALQVPGLIIIIGIWLGLSLVERLTSSVKPSILYNLVLFSVLLGILGARIGYVLEFPSAFSDNPLNIISLNLALFNLFAGIGVGLIVAIIYGQKKQLPFWGTLDALTPLFGVFMIALSISNLASGNAFGSPTDLPWGIDLWGSHRHPTQVYEIILSTIILGLIFALLLKKQKQSDGIIFLVFLASTATARIFTEAFHGDSTLIFTGIRSTQLIAWFILAISLWILGKCFSEKKDVPRNLLHTNPQI
ncbi:MAG: prolipoprotein diacylglyceryl transferase [Anaerolineales bacterium]|jgi:phosphatidylglycerol:prolipoprotein diacylglycerol transferase|nr:prolipoprotein diacylglyceryl transferase [Anaerolineales bacterium]